MSETVTDTVTVTVRRSGRTFDAEALLDLAAPAALVWQTITDYPALPSFMPGIRACEVLDRRADGSTELLSVRQRGEFRFLVFAQSMTVELQIEHRAPALAVARATRFDVGLLKTRALDVFEGRYALSPLPASAGRPRTHLSYSARMVLRVPPPPGIGSMAVKQNLSAQLHAVAREVARRVAHAAA